MATATKGGGGTLSELYSGSKRQSMKIRDALESLERLEYASSSSSSMSSSNCVVPGSTDDQAAAIRRDIIQIQSLCSDMDLQWRSIASKTQRVIWKRKVEQVNEEAESIEQVWTNMYHGIRSEYKKSTREQNYLGELYGPAEDFKNGDSHVLRIFDDESQARDSVHRSSRLLEDAFATGVAILSKYNDQRDHLKRAQRKALDVLNTLGLSNSLLRLIERRNRVDKWIKYAGMFLTITILIIFWRWTR